MTSIDNDGCSEERVALTQRVLDAQSRMFRSGRLGREWLEVDLTMPQLKVLFILYADGGASMGQLAGTLGVVLSTVTGIIDRLVEHGMVQRQENPQDRRLVICQLTPRAIDTVERLHQAGRLHLGSVLGDLSLAELRTVAAGIEVLATAFQRQAAADQAGGADESGGANGLAVVGRANDA